tara:strand:+ start:1343 stop:2428 length:1086 start_codon:yes stop_codon:yes gene_type:complete
MAYNILGINPFHNGSVCVLADGEIVYFLEEERLSKTKYDANPFSVILDVLSRFKINDVVIGGINSEHERESLSYTKKNPYLTLIEKFTKDPNITYFNFSDHHHFSHSIHSYFHSGFSEALSLVIDGGGGILTNGEYIKETFFKISETSAKTIFQNSYKHARFPFSINIASAYANVTEKLGFQLNEEGKTMGLSSYGKNNPKIPIIFPDNLSDLNIVYEYIDNKSNRNRRVNIDISSDYNWHKDPSKITDLEKDLAWRIQDDTQKVVKNYIKKFIKKTGIKNVVCSGGYFLNCVANYYLTKNFPDIKFYFEPVSNDAGIAVGAAYWRWKELNPNFQSKKLKSLYLGPQYSKKELLEGIKKYA